jgi:uncharacterized protein (TIGR02757 family)
MMNEQEIFEFLNQKAEQYNHVDFIELDPISIPHQFSLKQDIEISGFFAATIAWGNRKSIITSAQKIIDFMGNSPYDFVMNVTQKDFKKLENISIKLELTNPKGILLEILLVSNITEQHSTASFNGIFDKNLKSKIYSKVRQMNIKIKSSNFIFVYL